MALPVKREPVYNHPELGAFSVYHALAGQTQGACREEKERGRKCGKWFCDAALKRETDNSVGMQIYGSGVRVVSQKDRVHAEAHVSVAIIYR